MSILDKIKKAKLVGRGGACFPVGQKWEMVKKAEGKIKYVVCNASEGEPGVSKDFFITYKRIVFPVMFRNNGSESSAVGIKRV